MHIGAQPPKDPRKKSPFALAYSRFTDVLWKNAETPKHHSVIVLTEGSNPHLEFEPEYGDLQLAIVFTRPRRTR